MALATTCPHCGVAFRVRPEQLQRSRGVVRCSACGTPFNVNEHMHSVAETPEVTRFDPRAPRTDTIADLLAPSLTRSTHEDGDEVPDGARAPGAKRPLPGWVGSQAAGGAAPDGAAAGARHGAIPPWARTHDTFDEAAGDAIEFEEAPTRDRMAIVVALLAVLAVLQALLLSGQAVADAVPVLRPMLHAIGVAAAAPRQLDQIELEGFELRATDRADALQLNALLRNRAGGPIAWPWLELTLTDASGVAVIRKALSPADYLQGTRSGTRLDAPLLSAEAARAGIAAHSELPIRLTLRIANNRTTGYTARLFYP